MNVQVVHKFAAVCKRCQDVGPETYSHDTAAKAARDKGWTDLCADCRKVPSVKPVAVGGLVQ